MHIKCIYIYFLRLETLKLMHKVSMKVSTEIVTQQMIKKMLSVGIGVEEILNTWLSMSIIGIKTVLIYFAMCIPSQEFQSYLFINCRPMECFS